MYCRQCEQASSGVACTVRGSCGKTQKTSQLQDELTGALINATKLNEEIPDKLLLEALFATLSNVNYDDEALIALIDQFDKPFRKYYSFDYGEEDIGSLRTLLMVGIRGLAAYTYHAFVLGCDVSEITEYIRRALAAIARVKNKFNHFVPLVMECGKVNLAAMELLDRANTNNFGDPVPTTVSRTIEAGPFIVVSGHDLQDLKLLLEQTEGKGVNVYTHGEMLPAHAYPELKKFAHLKGNFGTAWPKQRKEIPGTPGAFLFTTNCLFMPDPEFVDVVYTKAIDEYCDRVFTTSVAAYKNLVHIGEDKDFTPVINKAIELGGYPEAQAGGTFTTGYGHNAMLSSVDKMIAAVKSGDIKHFFLVAGCDGSRPSRYYYTEFVEKTPKDSLVLTLGCGKFRFNDQNLGTIGEFPRLLDMGQCNDAYSAIKVAQALADSLNCGVNDLPLTMVLSWYEQKAVAILLSLFHLGVKNIYLGPTLPAFLTPNVLNHLIENFNIMPITTPEEDMAKMLSA